MFHGRRTQFTALAFDLVCLVVFSVQFLFVSFVFIFIYFLYIFQENVSFVGLGLLELGFRRCESL